MHAQKNVDCLLTFLKWTAALQLFCWHAKLLNVQKKFGC